MASRPELRDQRGGVVLATLEARRTTADNTFDRERTKVVLFRSIKRNNGAIKRLFVFGRWRLSDEALYAGRGFDGPLERVSSYTHKQPSA